MQQTLMQILRVVAVLALLGGAAAIATPRRRLPLALRGVCRIMKRDRGESAADGREKVPARRRLLAFALVLAAVVLAML